jgi:MoxR-like ATPase
MDEVNNVVWGQEDVVQLTLTCSLAGGNVLLEGVPGLAKTLFLQNLAPIMALDFKRVQFTPDLMPADILGSEILQKDPETGKQFFEFQEGPIFTQLFMADEINRAGPRTQAALLQAMQEKEVTVAGSTRMLSNPFMVVATQNPLEQDGTYPLPEAQLDRFLLKVNLDYPNRAAEKRVLVETTSSDVSKYRKLKERRAAGEDLTIRKQGGNHLDVNRVLESPMDLVEMQELAKTLPLTEEFTEAVLSVVRQTRPTNKNAPDIVKEQVAYGAGPRAEQAFAQAARARALIEGRYAPDLSDVRALAKPILAHRMKVGMAGHSRGITEEKVIDEVLNNVLDM